MKSTLQLGPVALFAIVSMLASWPAPAQARLVAVDGDSLLETTTGERIRLENIDAPELHGRCPAETELAYRAKAMTGWLIRQGATVKPVGRLDRYGRTLALVDIRGAGDLGEQLVRAGLARPYHGGRRLPWC